MNRITEHNPFIFSKHINRSTVNNILNLLILLAFIILLCKISMSINYDFQSDFQSICCFAKSIIVENFTDNKKNTDDPMNTALVLTTCVKPNKKFITKVHSDDAKKEIEKDLKERVNLYKNVIDKYLDRTKLNIHIIESSGSNILRDIYKDNDRVKYYTFKLDKPTFFYNINNESTTAYEAYSILQAYENFNLSKYGRILKITGRYFIPNIENIINTFQENADIYVQNTVYHDSLSQRCEVIGMKSNICQGLMISVIKKKVLMERFLYDLYKEHSDNPNPPYIAQRIDLIKLEEPVSRGGDGQTFNEL